MRKAFSVSQAQEIDRLAICKFGIPSLVLMENAGRKTAQEILKICSKKDLVRVCVFCGTGNNGGDGFVVARHLLNYLKKVHPARGEAREVPSRRLRRLASGGVKVFLVGKPQDLKQDPAICYQLLKRLKCPVKSIRRVSPEVLEDLKYTTVIVDAIFGIGLSRPIDEPFRSIINAINQSKKKVVAVDVPSGLDATTGKILGICVNASHTVTFAVMKKGFLTHHGPCYAGKVIIVDIGIPQQAIDEVLSRKKHDR